MSSSSSESEYDPREALEEIDSDLTNLENVLQPLLDGSSGTWNDVLATLENMEQAKMGMIVAYGVCDLIWSTYRGWRGGYHERSESLAPQAPRPSHDGRDSCFWLRPRPAPCGRSSVERSEKNTSGARVLHCRQRGRRTLFLEAVVCQPSIVAERAIQRLRAFASYEAVV